MVLFIIGILLIAVAIWGMVDISRKKRGPMPLMVLALMVGCGVFVAGFFLVFGERLPPPEPKVYTYPASEYRLQLRIVEFEGQRDTTYVLVEKIKELSHAEDNVQ